MAVINTNITALIGQQNLNRSQSALQTAMERLSSGLRINSAADDAAGQAIANRMSAQITGLSQAQRNANDGISVAQTAEGALNQVNDNLQRIRELTVQAANGTNSDSDLSSIQDEINERLAEINRVSEQTSFNGVDVLAKDQTLSIQVGANDGQTINIQLQQINSTTLGLGSFDVTKALDSTITNVSSVGGDTIDTSGVDASALNSGSGATVGDIGLATDGNWYVQVSGGAAGENGWYQVTMGSDGKATATLAIGGADETTTPAGWSATTETPTVAIDTSSLAAPGAGTLAEGGEVSRVVQDTGGNYYVQVTGADNDAGNGFYEVDIDGTDGSMTLTDDWDTQATIPGAPTGANAAPLEALDKALSQVDDLRSNLGAMQNRFDSAITNLSTTTTNLSAARSRIQDADYAVEVSNMTRAQILQQAGTSVLAQANQVPQTVLKLLG